MADPEPARLRALDGARGAGRGRQRPVLSAAQLERIYASFVQPVYGFVYARIGNKEDAEDLTSQVFMKSLHYLDPTATPGEIQSYLFRIARTHIADHWRRFHGLRVIPLDEEPEALQLVETDERRPPALEALVGELERILGLLPPQYRRVLELRFYEGRSIKETAHAMQVSEANAKVLQYRAVQRAAALARSAEEAP